MNRNMTSLLKQAFFYLFVIDPQHPWPGLPDRNKLSGYARKAALLFVFFWVLYVLMLFAPEGFDWYHFFGRGRYPVIWTPWARYVVALFNLPALRALTVLALFIRTYQYNRSPLPAALAFFSLPTIWMTFYLGNLDGLVLLGLLILPWGAPLVLIKPQVASFALLARRRSMAIGALWLGISVLIWGLWPLNLLIMADPNWKTEWVQDITLFPWGLLLALPLMWFCLPG